MPHQIPQGLLMLGIRHGLDCFSFFHLISEYEVKSIFIDGFKLIRYMSAIALRTPKYSRGLRVGLTTATWAILFHFGFYLLSHNQFSFLKVSPMITRELGLLWFKTYTRWCIRNITDDTTPIKPAIVFHGLDPTYLG
jgi:hypothetical protein|tara:strand:+ start:1282 stop:1692 length:411 start_codon:yes stop_codon:yes gene_type:complete